MASCRYERPFTGLVSSVCNGLKNPRPSARGGAENVSFEGIRCATGERRIYASGRKDGTWSPLKNSAWQPIVDNGYNRPRAALAHDYFCDGPAGPRDREHALRLLRQKRDLDKPFGVHQ